MNLKNIFYANLVTSEMFKSSYWLEKRENTDNELMTIKEIKELNKKIIENKETKVIDLENFEINTKLSELTEQLSNIEIPLEDLYINRELIDKNKYFSKIIECIKQTRYKNNNEEIKYGIAVKKTDVKAIPTNDIIGYSIDDPDDKMQDGVKFYWGYSNTYSGWINAENIAICKSKQEWIDAWKYDINNKDFIIVTQDKIVLDDNLELMLGTVLKLVPNDKIPHHIKEKWIGNNYVVYISKKDENGMYIKDIALISEQNKVSIGVLPMTERQILYVAFSCLGNKYGWGGMKGRMDCSLLIKSVYKCFGIELPRDSKNQVKIFDKVLDISNLTDIEKEKYISTLPIGSILFFPGHVMMYIGTENSINYVINAVGSLIDGKDKDIKKIYSIIINSLEVKRANGYSWINSITKVVNFKEVCSK